MFCLYGSTLPTYITNSEPALPVSGNSDTGCVLSLFSGSMDSGARRDLVFQPGNLPELQRVSPAACSLLSPPKVKNVEAKSSDVKCSTQEENLLSPHLCLLGLYIWVQVTRSVRKEVQFLFSLSHHLG